MDVTIAEQKAFVFADQLSDQTVRERAIEKKLDAFGTVAKFLQRPKPEEIQLTYSEKRYEAFWYVAAKATYIYDRSQRYRVPLPDAAVKKITIAGTVYEPQKERDSRVLVLSGVEHCEDITERQVYLDAVSGEKRDLSAYLKFASTVIPDLREFKPEHALIVEPQVRIAQVVRELVQSLMKSFQADTMLDDRVEISQVGLYFHPIYAFEYHWVPKDKKQVIEFDGLTGVMRTEGKAIQHGLKNFIDNDLLFDLSSEAVNLVVPGGAIAIKLARAAAQKTVGGHN